MCKTKDRNTNNNSLREITLAQVASDLRFVPAQNKVQCPKCQKHSLAIAQPNGIAFCFSCPFACDTVGLWASIKDLSREKAEAEMRAFYKVGGDLLLDFG